MTLVFQLCLFCAVVVIALAKHGKPGSCDSTAVVNITGTIYADNWFRFYFNGEFVAEDPIDFIPHQAVSVQFEAPECGDYLFAIEARDYSDDITALEYENRCVGDGGLKAQFSDGTVTNGDWRCFTMMYGPLAPESCIPDYDPDIHFTPPICKYHTDEQTAPGCRAEYFAYSTAWIDPGYSDKKWSPATVFDDETVGFGVEPDDCEVELCPEYLDWAEYGDEAQFIWQPDLNFDNRIFCRYEYFQTGNEANSDDSKSKSKSASASHSHSSEASEAYISHDNGPSDLYLSFTSVMVAHPNIVLLVLVCGIVSICSAAAYVLMAACHVIRHRSDSNVAEQSKKH